MKHIHIIETTETDDRSEELEVMRMLKATSAYLALWDIKENIRRMVKNTDSEELEEAQTMIYETIENRGINLDDELE